MKRNGDKPIYEEELSEKEKKLLKFLKLEFTKTGYMPSVREIVRRTDIGALGTIAGLFKKLEQKGFLRKIERPNASNKYEIIREDDEARKQKRLEEARKYRVLTVLVAKIPLLGKIQFKENIYHERNFEQYISVPIEYSKQDNLYAFISTNNLYKKQGILKDSIVVFDVEQRYIHLDIVAKYSRATNQIRVATYTRGEDTTNILGKVVGAYTKITYED
ncbi:MAG: hypothetical protein ACTTGJ_01770 [Clostridium sp.]